MIQEATVETFASALFGPSGKAKDEGQQEWQRETLFETAIQSIQSNRIFLLNELMLLIGGSILYSVLRVLGCRPVLAST